MTLNEKHLLFRVMYLVYYWVFKKVQRLLPFYFGGMKIDEFIYHCHGKEKVVHTPGVDHLETHTLLITRTVYR